MHKWKQYPFHQKCIKCGLIKTPRFGKCDKYNLNGVKYKRMPKCLPLPK